MSIQPQESKGKAMAELTVKGMLLKEMKELQGKNPDIKKSRAIAKVAAQLIYTDRLEMEEKVHTLKLRKFVKNT